MPSAPPAALARTRWYSTLKARLMLASALVIAASVSVATLVVLHRVEQRSAIAVMDLERDNAERMASLLGQRVVGMQKMLRATADSMPEAARTDRASAVQFLQGNPALTATFATLFLANAQGDVLAAHDGIGVVAKYVSVADRDFYNRTVAQGVPVVSPPLLGRLSKEPVIQLTMPVLGEGGRVVAVLGGALRLASRNLFDDLTYAGGSGGARVVTIVTDAAGTIISHPQRDRVMRSIEAEPGLAVTVAGWVAQGRPVEPSGFAGHEDGQFIALAGVPGADWMVFRLAPDTDLMGGLVQARREAMQWAAGVALLGSLLILALLAALLGPLSQLRERARTLHDTHRTIDEGWPQSRGEIGEVGRVLQQVLRERVAGEKALHLLVSQMGSVLTAAPVGIAFTRGGRFELTGDEFGALLGWAPGALVGRLAHDIFASQYEYQRLATEVARAFEAGRPFFSEMQFQRRDGSTFWGRLQGRPVQAGDASAGSIWLLEDVTERREARARLSWSATHDTLTRLFNRAAFEERLGQWLLHAQPGMTASLLFIDLDRFKQVNDSAGHAAGDRVLRDVATALHDQVRGGDLVARMGGDEFALLLPGCVAAVAVQMAERVRALIAVIGIDHAGQRLTIGASIGVVEIDPAQALPAAQWMARVDAACYAAKHAGRDAVRLARDEALH